MMAKPFPLLQKPTKTQLKIWGRLDKAKFREETGLFLAEGFKIVRDLLDSDWETQALLFLEEKKDLWMNLCETLPVSLPCYELTGKEWQGLTQDVAPEGIMAVGVIPRKLNLSDIIAGQRRGPLLLLHEINNPGNLGALVRTASWFGFSGIILSRGSVDPLNPKVIRAAMGGIFHMPLLSGITLSELLPRIKESHNLIGSSVRTGNLPHPCGANTALLLGSESHGLPDDLLQMTDEQWHIPRQGEGESLSLPQAAAILMYELVRGGPSRR